MSEKRFKILRIDWRKTGREDYYRPAPERLVVDVSDAIGEKAYWTFHLDAGDVSALPGLRAGDCVLDVESGEGWIVTGSFAGRSNLLGVPKNVLAMN